MTPAIDYSPTKEQVDAIRSNPDWVAHPSGVFTKKTSVDDFFSEGTSFTERPKLWEDGEYIYLKDVD